VIEFFKSLFGGQPAEPENELDPRVAATALMVEAALSDGVYADMEEDSIRKILAGAFGLSDDEASAILAEAEELAEAAVDHYRFTKVVKENLTRDQREALVEHLWDVAYADGERAPVEDAFIRRVAPLLAVDDRARIRARKRAENHAESGD